MSLFKWFKIRSRNQAQRGNSARPRVNEATTNSSEPTAEVPDTRVYELDGVLLLPDQCWSMTPSDVMRQSKVPLERQSVQGSYEEILHVKSYKLIHGFTSGHLDEVCVNAKYPTSFLGISSGEPERVISAYGYEIIVRMPGASTYSYLPSTPNHFIAVNRHDSPAFVELYYSAKTIDNEFLNKLREKRADKAERVSTNIESEVGQLVLQLIRIGTTCGYEAKKEETRRIGQKLSDIGGLRLMQSACYQVINMIGSRAGTEIERIWDGIGDWSL